MAHGSTCDCMVCSLGKKVGMIKKSDEHTHETGAATCPTCNAPLSETGTCPNCSASQNM